MYKYPVYKPYIGIKEFSNVIKCIKSGWISSLGKEIDEFEDKFSSSVGCKYGVSVSNATCGLHLVLASLNLNENDEVIVPDLTFIATANAVNYTKAKIILCDISKDDLNIDVNELKKLITPNTKAIIPVHLYGAPCNMDEITKIAEKEKIFILEDAAEAHFAMYKNKPVGSLGDAAVFSFYGNKIMTTGEGGMITTNNKNLYVRLKLLRDHAMSKDKRYWHDEVGFNYRLTNLQASFGLAQLSRKKYIIEKKVQIFYWYKENLKNIKGLHFNHQNNNIKNIFWLVNVFHKNLNQEKISLIKKELNINGIDIRELFYPLSMLPPYYNKNKKTGNSHAIFNKGFSLPSYTSLSKKDVKHISKIVREIIIDVI